MNIPELDLDPAMLAIAQQRTAMRDPEHLRRFLLQSDRKYLVLNALDMVEALPWPDGHDALIQCVTAYNHERQARPSGWVVEEEVADPLRGGRRKVEIKLMQHELLEPEEIDEAIAQLQRLKTQVESERKRQGAYRG